MDNMTSQKTSRLSKDDWIKTGMAALSERGPSALAAEPLARRLSTTKGSFYWHFSDLPAYQDALLQRWETDAISEIVEALAEEFTDVGRLRRFGQVIADKSGLGIDGACVEPAIRAWALATPNVAEAVARVDRKRMTYLSDLLAGIDVTNPEMARIIYAASIGMDALGSPSRGANEHAMGSLVDLVLALRY